MDALSDLRIPHLSNGLDVTEGSSTGTLGDKPDGLVDTAHGRHVDSLATDHTTLASRVSALEAALAALQAAE